MTDEILLFGVLFFEFAVGFCLGVYLGHTGRYRND
jgi:hypothetical protein